MRQKPTRVKSLTGPQRKVLDAVRAAVERDGWAPSVREICATVGVVSTNTVRFHLRNLEEMGYLRRGPGKARAIEVIDPPSGQ